MAQQLTLFISSKMKELAIERLAVQEALKDFQMKGWLWEEDAGARPEPVRSVYLQEVADSDIYLGLFWLGYGPYTIEEFRHAHNQLHKPCLIYKKHSDLDQRDPLLTAFLHELQQVENLPVCPFQTPEQLARQVQHDVIHLLTTVFQETRTQLTGKTRPARKRNPSVSAKNHSIAIGGDNSGSIEQIHYDGAQLDGEDYIDE